MPSAPMSFRRYLATSEHEGPRLVRAVRRRMLNFTLPWPRPVITLMLAVYLVVRGVYFAAIRLLLCEPLFKAHCTTYGRNVRGSVYVHWFQGKGELHVGDNVEVRGKCSFTFAARFTDRPVLRIGSNTNIGHSCSFVVGKGITIGDHCLIASEVVMFDSSGHPSDPTARYRGEPLEAEHVKPISIGSNVWICQRSIISPGVTIGDNSIVSAGSVVVSDVPPNVVVAGYPARRIANLEPREVEAPYVRGGVV